MHRKAYLLARKAYEGLTDKGGNPYFLHAVTIAERMPVEDEKIVALLHDVIEDTGMTIQDLKKEGFSNEIIMAIVAITRNKDEPYDDYILRVKENPIGKKVKIQDLLHNMDLTRIPEPSQKDIDRVEKYRKALNVLGLYNYAQQKI